MRIILNEGRSSLCRSLQQSSSISQQDRGLRLADASAKLNSSRTLERHRRVFFLPFPLFVSCRPDPPSLRNPRPSSFPPATPLQPLSVPISSPDYPRVALLHDISHLLPPTDDGNTTYIMSDTPDFSTFNWPNSQQTSGAEPADPASYSQHASYNTRASQHPSDVFSHHDSPPINGASNPGTGPDSSSSASGGPAGRGDPSVSEYAHFSFGQPSGTGASQSDSQGGYYSMNGGIDPSQTSYGADGAAGYTPIDPALTAAPTRGGASAANSFSRANASQTSGGASSYLNQHVPPSNFNTGRRYSVPAISSTATAPYTVPRRQNMYPPALYSQRTLDPALTSSPSFVQPPSRSSASFTSPLRSFQQAPYTNLDRRMSMPTNSLWQLDHQTTSTQTPQTQSPPVAPHTDPRPRQHSMVDWRLSSTMPSRNPTQPENTLLADLDASQGMLSLRGQWGTHSQGSDPSLDYGGEFQDDGARRGSYEASGMLAGTPAMYDPSGRRASVDSNATQPGSVLGDGMKKHACPLCQKKFTRPSSLQTHMYSHTGEKRIHLTFPIIGG